MEQAELADQKKRVVFVGLPGAGKTQVVKGGIVGTRFREVNFGDEMVRVAKKMKLVEHRDEIRSLDPNIQKEIQMQAGLSIASMNGQILVNTHCTINTPKGYMPGLPDFLLDALKPDMFIAVWASPQDIDKWRSLDPSRQRDAQNLQELTGHADANDKMLVHYAKYTGKPVVYIQNIDGELARTQEKLRTLLR